MPNLTRKTTIITLSFLIVAVAALAILAMGHVPICKCGYVKLWHGMPVSSENSQHLSDWYSFSHVIHGFAFYAILWLIPWTRRMPWGAKFLIALGVESGWEIFENTDFVINRYRETTISLDYYGDSVINSVFDILFMVVGYVAAAKWPIWTIVALTIFMELLTLYYIRDNLALNIIMLLYPSEAILKWQSG